MPIPANLIHLWELEETSGTRFDSVGMLHLNNIIGSPGSNAGKVNQCMDLSGADAVYISTSAALDGLSGYTVSCWVNFDNAASALECAVTFSSDPLGAALREYCYIRRTAAGLIAARTVNNTPTGYDLISTSTVGSGSWNHIVVVFEQNVSTRLYLNNVEEDSVAVANVMSTDQANSQLLLGGNRSGVFRMTGLLDQVAVFDDALTVGDIDDLWNGGDGLDYEAPVVNRTSYLKRRRR